MAPRRPAGRLRAGTVPSSKGQAAGREAGPDTEALSWKFTGDGCWGAGPVPGLCFGLVDNREFLLVARLDNTGIVGRDGFRQI